MLSISISAHASGMHLGYLELEDTLGLVFTHQEGAKLLGLSDSSPLQLRQASFYILDTVT